MPNAQSPLKKPYLHKKQLMSIDTANLDYILNAIRRDFNDEFPDTTLIFISAPADKLQETLLSWQEEILTHPAGRLLWPHLQTLSPQGRQQTGAVSAFARHEYGRYFSLLKKEAFLGVFLINTDERTAPDEGEEAAFVNKHLAYTLIWDAVHIREGWQRKHPALENHEGVLQYKASHVEWLREQMMIDCFATMMLESKGEKGAISTLLKKRCALCLQPALGYRPENFPFPVALDATHLVYKDLKDAAAPGAGPLAHSYFMAQEIGQTYDDMSLKQWVSFCRAAQEMALAGHGKNEILGAAVYTSDNPYTRSTAYIVAETLNTDPVPLKHHDFYNPFTDDEINERLHLKRCRDMFDILLEKIEDSENPDLILSQIQRNNTELLEGNPAGWCALPLLAAHRAYLANSEDSPVQNSARAFRNMITEVKWPLIRKLHRLLIGARRAGEPVDHQTAQFLIAAHEDLHFMKPAFDLPNVPPAK
ncbi:MAG: hypothetical protein IT559_06440 [Alphaproteobacteria bacterium]|nr:hypothetical protein [Alphaproteobacteria bacterium]